MTGHRNILGMVGPRFNAAVIARALFESDATISITGRPFDAEGFVVAIPEYASIAIDYAGVEEWVRDNAAAILNFPAPFHRPRFFGSWTFYDEIFLDIVEVFPREEKDAAIAAGVARNQIAIWDNGAGVEIVIGAVA